MSGYQDFDDRAGVSKSSLKLDRIKLPGSLKGKRVLDLGCNEGFFCLEARKRGASHVLGIDHNTQAIEAARQRAGGDAGIRFIVGDVGQIPDETFDIIIFLSALHYIADPMPLFARIGEALSPTGSLILECGVSSRPGVTLQRALRSIDDRIFPSYDLLTKVWLRDYSVRFIGGSVNQHGDPVERKIFHCHRRRSTVVFILGDGGIGKSMLASQIGDAVLISCDALVGPIKASQKHFISPQQSRFDKIRAEKKGSIRLAWEIARRDSEIIDFFAEVVVKAIVLCRGSPLIVVEGHVLGALHLKVEAKLGQDFRCWATSRSTRDVLRSASDDSALGQSEAFEVGMPSVRDDLKELAGLPGGAIPALGSSPPTGVSVGSGGSTTAPAPKSTAKRRSAIKRLKKLIWRTARRTFRFRRADHSADRN